MMRTWASQLLFLFLLACPVACVSWTVTKEEIFKDLRDCLERWRDRKPCKLRCKVHYLCTCYYCFSHWVAVVAIGGTGALFLSESWVGYVLAWLTLAFLSQWWLGSFNILRAKLREVQARADLFEKEVKGAG